MAEDTHRPLLTFALFSYNQEKFIREAVAGALAQTYSPLEIIFSDDHSSDQTFEIIQEMVRDYQGPHKIILNKNPQNMGLCGHVSHVFKLASSDWVIMAAGDDVSLPERCEKLLESVKKHPHVAAVTSDWFLIDEDGKRLSSFRHERFLKGRVDRWGDMDWLRKFKLGKAIGVHGATCMWAKRLIDSFGPLDKDAPAEDAVLSFRAYLSGSVVYLPEKLVCYRTHDNNVHGFKEDDLIALENKRTEFSRRSAVSILQIQKDYEKYKKEIGDQSHDDLMSNFFEAVTANNNLASTWWEHGFFWRVAQVVRASFCANWVLVRWGLARLGTKAMFVSVTNLKRKMVGKHI